MLLEDREISGLVKKGKKNKRERERIITRWARARSTQKGVSLFIKTHVKTTQYYG